MIKSVIIVLCCIYYITRVLSLPVIKASGVQWSEPKGTGKGNISLIMIPQNESCGNDSDVIVAVKSDYQILSQDTQLLDLIVNEKQKDTINESKNNLNSQKWVATTNSKIQSECLNNKVDTANYFETEKKAMPVELNNISLNSSQMSLNKDKNHVLYQKNASVTDYSTINILNLLGLADNNVDKKYSNNDKVSFSLSSTEASFDLLKFFSVTRPNSPSKLKITSNLVDRSPTITPAMANSNNKFLNQALNIIEKLKQDASYYDNSEKSNKELMNQEAVGKGEYSVNDVKNILSGGGNIISDLDEGKAHLQEVLNIKNDGINLESNLEDSNLSTGTTESCVPFFGASQFESSQQGTTELPNSPSLSYQPILHDESSSAAPQAGKGQAAITQSAQISTLEQCRTMIIDCNQPGLIDIIQKISAMVQCKTEMISPQLPVTLSAGVETTSSPEILTQCFTVTGNRPLAAKQAVPKKITLEPQVTCESFFGMKDRYNSDNHNNNAEIENSGFYLPSKKSSGLLANIVIPKSNALKAVNTSSEDFIISNFQEKSDKTHENSAELYPNNPLLLNIIENALLPFTSFKPMLAKNDGTKTVLLKNLKNGKNKISSSDLNNILSVRFDGKHVVLDQNPSYRADMSEHNCEPTPEGKSTEPEADYADERQESLVNLSEKVTTEMSTVEIQTTSTLNTYDNAQLRTSAKLKTTTLQSDSNKQDEEEISLSQTKIPGKTTTKKVSSVSEPENVYDELKTTINSVAETTKKKNLTTVNDRSTVSLQKFKMASISTIKSTNLFTKPGEEEISLSQTKIPGKTTTRKVSSVSEPENLYDKLKTTINSVAETTKKKDLTTVNDGSTVSLQKFKMASISTIKPTNSFTRPGEEEISLSQTKIPVKTTTKKVSSVSEPEEEENMEPTTDLHLQSFDIISEQQTIQTSDPCITTAMKSIHEKINKYTQLPSKHITQTKTSCSTEPSLSNLHGKPNHEQEQPCNKNMYIPANSVKEIVIQIVRNTKKPGQARQPDSDDSWSHEEKQENLICEDAVGQPQQANSDTVIEVPPAILTSNENERKTAGGKFIFPNKYTPTLNKNEEPLIISEDDSINDIFPVPNRNSIFIQQNKYNSNEKFQEADQDKVQNIPLNQKYNLMKSLTNDKSVTMKSLAKNILKLMKEDKPELKHV